MIWQIETSSVLGTVDSVVALKDDDPLPIDIETLMVQEHHRDTAEIKKQRVEHEERDALEP